MIKTRAHIEQQKAALCARKPELANVQIVPLRETAIFGQMEEIAAFMELCWAATYGKQDRFHYEGDYLDWVFGAGRFDHEMSLVALWDGEPAGLILATPRTLLYQGREMKTAISTAFSVKPSATNQGLSRYLFLCAQAQAVKTLPCIFCWFHSSIRNTYSSHRIHSAQEKDYFDNWGPYPLRSRSFDFNRTIKSVNLHGYEKLGLYASAALMPKRRLGEKRMEKITGAMAEEVCRALNDATRKRGEGRLFTTEELARYADFQGRNGEFAAAGWVRRNGQGRIDGVVIGYTIATLGKTRDRVFFLDLLYTEKNKRELIRSAEGEIRNMFDVYAVVTPDGQLGLREGYLPTRTVLSLYSIPFSEAGKKTDAIKRKTPILDHK